MAAKRHLILSTVILSDTNKLGFHGIIIDCLPVSRLKSYGRLFLQKMFQQKCMSVCVIGIHLLKKQLRRYSLYLSFDKLSVIVVVFVVLLYIYILLDMNLA